MTGFKQLSGEIVSEYNILITKEPVVGFLVTANREVDGNCWISVRPLEANWEGGDFFSIHLDKEEKIVGIIPAPHGSYIVRGLMPDDTYELLGYEFPGAYHPDWLDELIKKT
ncbi:hypothetical protein SAMN00808754_1642 [Thermanaeromonas toyohensis ToBE]|uniref:Uncharacterized protein n=1 Tax=Thermanaeromonas toyohensis ToBE TaxID=698762 RepID=A0A1W1VU58_9FIRM|nr:hypothetical protein [Thermanaeromonas toyohensis]SMB96770.1 hypothetical protein SAMN00808754_1642 [Thermanaeromonas toyohensis ToBE]